MQLVGRILKIQTLVAVLLAGLGVFFISWPFGMSALIGGLIAAIPQLIFGLWAFRVRGARNARRITQNVFVGEALKLMTTAVAFVAVWTSVPWLDAAGLFAGFVMTIVTLQLSLPWTLGRAKTL
jgi:F0F1-type ATP synthase, subunit I